MNRILIAEDEPRLASFLEKGLRSNGFVTTVAEDGAKASLLARDDVFDLLVLDLGLPGKDGTEVLRELRASGQRMPVIILTARDDVSDKVSGLEGGADDYVTKPFRFEELLARVRAPCATSAPSSAPCCGRARSCSTSARAEPAPAGARSTSPRVSSPCSRS